jgi:hypothetical protein
MTTHESAAARNKKVEKSDRLYEQYGKPYEADHYGEFVAIRDDGRTVIAPTLVEVVDKAVAELGKGCFIFKIGPKTVWTHR